MMISTPFCMHYLSVLAGDPNQNVVLPPCYIFHLTTCPFFRCQFLPSPRSCCLHNFYSFPGFSIYIYFIVPQNLFRYLFLYAYFWLSVSLLVYCTLILSSSLSLSFLHLFVCLSPSQRMSLSFSPSVFLHLFVCPSTSFCPFCLSLSLSLFSSCLSVYLFPILCSLNMSLSISLYITNSSSVYLHLYVPYLLFVCLSLYYYSERSFSYTLLHSVL